MDNPTGQEISVEEYKNSVLGFIRQQVEASGHILGNNAQVKLSFAGLGQETIAALNNAGFYDGQILAVDEMEKVTKKTKKVSIKGSDRTTLKFLRGARNIVNNESSEKEYGDGHAGDYYRSELGKRTKSGGDLFKHSAARLAPASGNLKVLPLEETGLGDGPSYGVISFEGAHELLKMGKGAKTSDVVDAYDAIIREIKNDEDIQKQMGSKLWKKYSTITKEQLYRYRGKHCQLSF